ncbi:hypothetical protein GE061_007021 [Apolygus lucorum]|uniref:V-type proton ATPase subunit n=1 Tax=Apolygus lucorum TaxID=248454 RepID=A0A6A4IQD2_APOLU|nr:hypothetical protein GE061_007021 [Apolygus lucorum]
MAISVIPCALITGFWAIVGIVAPIFVPKGPNKGIIQLSLVLTAVTCYLFWLCTYMSQMNPLIGPKLKTHMILNIAREWGNAIKDLNTENSTMH